MREREGMVAPIRLHATSKGGGSNGGLIWWCNAVTLLVIRTIIIVVVVVHCSNTSILWNLERLLLL